MADKVFEGLGEFGEGLGVAVGDEEGIIAEAAGAVRGGCDRSVADAFRDVEDCSSRVGVCDDADETCASIGVTRFRKF